MLSTEQHGDTLLLRIDRPPVNALDLPLLLALVQALVGIAEAPPKGGLVLTGSSKAFCAGVDVRLLAHYDDEQRAAVVESINMMARTLFLMPTATVAAVNGHAVGGGLVLALACDWRLFAQTDSRHGLAEVSAGVPYPNIAWEIIESTLGAPACRRMALGGDLYLPEEMERLGVADALAAPEALIGQAIVQARHLSALSGFAMIKRQQRAGARARIEALEAVPDPLVTFLRR